MADDDCSHVSWTKFWTDQEEAKQRFENEIDASRIRKADAETNSNFTAPCPCPSSAGNGNGSTDCSNNKENCLANSVLQKCEEVKASVSEKCDSACASISNMWDNQNENKSKDNTKANNQNSSAVKNSNVEAESAVPGGDLIQNQISSLRESQWKNESLDKNPFVRFEKSRIESINDGKRFTGKYTLVKSENFDEFMKELGVGYFSRIMSSASKPVTEIIKNDDVWRIKTNTADIYFRMGIPFNEHTADGRKCKSTITKIGRKLVHDQKCDHQKEYQIIREFDNNEMTVTFKAGDVVSKRVYKKN